jgi:hypothetical protein
MKILQKRFVVPLIIAIIIIVAGIWLYWQFNTSIFPPNPLDRAVCPRGFDCKPAITGTPEQREKALDEIRLKIEKYNVVTIPEEEQTKIEEITPFIPSVIEAILDSTPLPRHEDTGWGNVSHYANTIMHMFAYRFDGVQRERNPIFSFNDATEKITDEDRKLIHDNWLGWWDASKYLK